MRGQAVAHLKERLRTYIWLRAVGRGASPDGVGSLDMSMKGGGTLLRSNKLFRLLFVSRVIR